MTLQFHIAQKKSWDPVCRVHGYFVFVIGYETAPYSISTHAEQFHLASFKESSASKQALMPWAMVFIIIGIHIQFCTSCFIFVNFVPGLILPYIDSHPPGRFAAICVWLHPVWLMRHCGLLCLWSCSVTDTGTTALCKDTTQHLKRWPLVWASL